MSSFAVFVIFIFTGFFASSCRCQTGNQEKIVYKIAREFKIDQKETLADLAFFTELPHPFDSDRQKKITQYLIKRAGQFARTVHQQDFQVATPNPAVSSRNLSGPRSLTIEKSGTNIIAESQLKSQSTCTILIGSHYDTKDVAGIDYVGANDSGSSSVLLLQLLRHLHNLDIDGLGCGISMIWFDGEEAVLPEWDDGRRRHPAKLIDNTYGSRFLVGSLKPCGKAKCLPNELGGSEVRALILLDMVGSPELVISREANSSQYFAGLLAAAARELELSKNLASMPKKIEDDHLPFIDAGIPAINLIDFEHTAHWHKKTDIISNLSIESVEKAGRLAIALALLAAINPQAIR